MTIERAYVEFLMLVNRNATNNKTNVDKARFVILFCNSQIKYLEKVLEKRNEDEIRHVQKLLVRDLPVVFVPSKSGDNYSAFALPENYFDFSNIVAIAKNDYCSGRKMTLIEAKSEDTEERWKDSNSNPSFEFAESYYHFSEDTVLLFKDGFEYEEVALTYYRYPVPVEIEGYKKEDGSVSTINVDPELDNKVVRKILIDMEKEFSAINSDPQGYQMSKDRLFTT